MESRSATGKMRHIFFLNLNTGEITESHRAAVDMYRAGDRVAVMEEKNGCDVLRVTWEH